MYKTGQVKQAALTATGRSGCADMLKALSEGLDTRHKL